MITYVPAAPNAFVVLMLHMKPGQEPMLDDIDWRYHPVIARKIVPDQFDVCATPWPVLFASELVDFASMILIPEVRGQGFLDREGRRYKDMMDAKKVCLKKIHNFWEKHLAVKVES